MQIIIILQGQAISLYKNVKQSGFDLPKAIQNKIVANCSKTVVGVLVAFIVSGCVSQQSALDFSGTQPVQPVPTGVSLAGNPAANSLDANSTVSLNANNVPIKAPRPSSSITQASIEPTIGQPLQTPSAAVTTPQTTPTLAVAETSTQAPTANVIAAATQPAANQTANAQTPAIQSTTQVATPPTTAIPSPNPATPQQSVEVASLSPTVEAAPSVEVPKTEVVKKKGFFETLFEPKEKTPRPSANVKKPKVQKTSRASSRISTASSIAERPSRKITKPKIKKPKTIVASVRNTRSDAGTALPGVKSNNEIFGIKNEGPDNSKAKQTTQVAAVGSFGRLSPNGLRVQHSKVQVACLKPGVLRILKQVERRYGKKPIITSGYRSPKGNRRAGGARNSQHIFCKAVDIQVEGVSKWQLAKYLRTIPGRGGVGTYCRTKSVHFDIGSKRDWHHPCRKSAKRKRKKT